MGLKGVESLNMGVHEESVEESVVPAEPPPEVVPVVPVVPVLAVLIVVPELLVV